MALIQLNTTVQNSRSSSIFTFSNKVCFRLNEIPNKKNFRNGSGNKAEETHQGLLKPGEVCTMKAYNYRWPQCYPKKMGAIANGKWLFDSHVLVLNGSSRIMQQEIQRVKVYVVAYFWRRWPSNSKKWASQLAISVMWFDSFRLIFVGARQVNDL